MALCNPEIHHRQSIRLNGFDYSRPGYYFVTVCLNDIRCMLAVVHGVQLKNGNIPHCKGVQLNAPTVNPTTTFINRRSLQLTSIGEIARRYWSEIPRHYPNVVLDEFVIMPDHVHGILKIRDGCGGFYGNVEGDLGRGVQLNARTNRNNSIQKLYVRTTNAKSPFKSPDKIATRSEYFSELSPMGRSLSVIIRNYKSTVKRWCNENGFPQFKWQRSFYDHIIRDEKSLFFIRQYIRNNPEKWIAGPMDHLAEELEKLS
jgi:putative transposase